MAVILQAPANLIRTVTVLPSPTVGDNYAPRNSVNVKRSMSGKIRTYVKRPSTYKIIMSFDLDIMKAFELYVFIKSYIASEIKLIDHHDRIWVGKLVSNPVELHKTATQKIRSGCLFERVATTLEFNMRKL